MSRQLQRNVIAAAALVQVALVAALAWRLETEYRGWVGATWVHENEFAVPVGLTLLLLWVTAVRPGLALPRRLAMIAVLSAVAALLYTATEAALVVVCRTPTLGSMLAYGRAGEILLRDWHVYVRIGYLWLAVIPLVVALAARAVGIRVGLWRLAAAEALWLASWPAARLLMSIPVSPFGHYYTPDFAHAVKSGLIIPFLVIALGVLLMPRAQEVGRRSEAAGARGAEGSPATP